jgi:catechol 2,3-dioxygenase-like lactoylglutathione lyase family enzyme
LCRRWRWQMSRATIATMTTAPTLRVARPSDNLHALLRFYEQGLGLTVLFRFENHEGFDGIMLGHPGAPYHFEFTRAHNHTAGRAPTQDNLVIFYLSDANEWKAAVERMRDAGFQPVPAFNPYWDRGGVTFEDPDGYRVVLHQSAWTQ